MHFTPTSASWLNMGERFFRSISTDRLERGVFRSVPELITAIEDYITVHNQNPKPLVWTAKANDILQKCHPRKSPDWFKEERSTTLAHQFLGFPDG